MKSWDERDARIDTKRTGRMEENRIPRVRRFRFGLVSIASSLALHSLLLAQESIPDTGKMYWMPEVVVTATRTEREVRDLSATISVMRSRDIEASTANSCMDVLGSLPGVFVQKTGPFGRADVDIRGIGSQGRRVGVFIDGRPVKMGLFGCTITHSLPIGNVERIEVVRGPLSVLYGSDALGGAINVITKKPRSDHEMDYTLSYGSFKTYQQRIRGGGQFGHFEFYATADRRSSQGHVANSAYDGEDYTVRLGLELTERIEAILMGKYFEGYKEEPEPADSGTWNDYERSAVDLSLNGRWNSIGSELKVYRNYGHHLLSDGWHSKDFTQGMTLALNRKQFSGNELSGGIEYKTQGGQVLDGGGEWNRSEYGVYLHDEQSVWNRAILVGGIRYHHDEVSGDIFCPQLGAVFHIGRHTTVRSSVNKGFRTPQISELYIFPSSNENLRPEVVYNYEIGLSHQLSADLTMNVSTYRITGENLIQLETNPHPPPGFMQQNTGEFKFEGVEVGMDARLMEGLNAQLNYSFLNPGEHTKGRVGSKLDLKCTYESNPYSFALTGQYVSDYFAEDNQKQRIPDFFVLNGKLTYRLLSGLRMFFATENVLNEKCEIYVDVPGSEAGRYRMPPRSFTAGVVFQK